MNKVPRRAKIKKYFLSFPIRILVSIITNTKIRNKVGRNQKKIITLSDGVINIRTYSLKENSKGRMANRLKNTFGTKAIVLITQYGINSRFAFFQRKDSLSCNDIVNNE